MYTSHNEIVIVLTSRLMVVEHGDTSCNAYHAMHIAMQYVLRQSCGQKLFRTAVIAQTVGPVFACSVQGGWHVNGAPLLDDLLAYHFRLHTAPMLAA